MIIDAHSHYMPPEVAKNTAFFKQFWSDIEGQLKVMDDNHVDMAVLLYPTSDAHLNMGGWGPLCHLYNEKISAIINMYPKRFIGAGIVPIDSPSNIPAELKRIEDFGFKALSLASSYDGKYLDDSLFDPVFEFAQSKSMPIHVHSQIMNPIGSERLQDPLLTPVLEYVFDVSVCIGKMMMNETFAKYPNVKFIFAHFGGVLPIVKERFESTYTMLRQRGFVKDIGKQPAEYFKNLFFDMSGTRSPAALQGALELVDESHILWGSDFPANKNIKACKDAISCGILSALQRGQILGGNAQRLFFQK